MLGPAVLKPLQYLGERGKRLLALCGFTSIAFRAVEGGPVMLRPSAALLLLLVSLALSFRFSGNAAPHKIPISDFAKTQDDNAVSRYVLVNQKGMEAVVITYGAALVSLKVANRSGRIQDLVLGRLVIDSVRKPSGGAESVTSELNHGTVEAQCCCRICIRQPSKPILTWFGKDSCYRPSAMSAASTATKA